jgi:hypothetical protein
MINMLLIFPKYEELDCREINPALNSWPAGLKEFRKIQEKIISIPEKRG